MIRALSAALLAPLLACLALAGCREAPPPPPPTAETTARPALWAVDDDAGQTAGWLFGTIHALPDGTRWRTGAVTAALGRAGVLVVEVRNLDQQAITRTFTRIAANTPGPPLLDRLPPASRRDLRALLSEQGVPATRFDGLETWAAALALARLGAAGEPENGVDRALIARFAPRPVRELEGAAAQLAIFDALPEEDQRAMLAAVVAEHGEGEAQQAAMARAWLAGDLARLQRLARRGLLSDADLYEALLAGRNRAWAQRILPMLERGDRPFVAVGAAHMLGADGLPALLAAQGYAVRRIQ